MTRAKKSLDDLYARRFQLWRHLVNAADFVRGSVVELRRPCTRGDRCSRCRSGEKHPATYLSVSRKGHTELLYLPKDVQPTAEEWVANYRRLMEVIEQVSEVNREILRRAAQGDREGK